MYRRMSVKTKQSKAQVEFYEPQQLIRNYRGVDTEDEDLTLTVDHESTKLKNRPN